jgi:hypothetical protein
MGRKQEFVPPPAPPNVDNVAGSPYAARGAAPVRQRAVREYVENLEDWLTQAARQGRAPKLGRRKQHPDIWWRKVAATIQGVAIGGLSGIGVAQIAGKGTYSAAIAQGLTGAALVGISAAIEDTNPEVSALLLAGGLSVAASAIGTTAHAVYATPGEVARAVQPYLPPQFGGPPVLPAAQLQPKTWWQTWSDAWSVLGTQ